MTGQIPEYELLADHFFEPEMVGKGSVIEFDGVPNNLMRPRNGAAEARLTEWYEESFPVLDEKTGKHVVDIKGEKQYHQPRLDLRPIELRGPAPKAAGLRVVSTPEPSKVAAEASVAAMRYQAPKEWTRPEPDMSAPAAMAPAPASTPAPGGVKVVEAKPALAGNTVKGPA